MCSETTSFKRKCGKKTGNTHTPKAVTYHEQSHYCKFMIGHSLGRMGHYCRFTIGHSLGRMGHYCRFTIGHSLGHEQSHYCRFTIGHSLGRMGRHRRRTLHLGHRADALRKVGVGIGISHPILGHPRSDLRVTVETIRVHFLPPPPTFQTTLSVWATFQTFPTFLTFYGTRMEEHTCEAKLPHTNGNVGREYETSGDKVGQSWGTKIT